MWRRGDVDPFQGHDRKDVADLHVESLAIALRVPSVVLVQDVADIDRLVHRGERAFADLVEDPVLRGERGEAGVEVVDLGLEVAREDVLVEIQMANYLLDRVPVLRRDGFLRSVFDQRRHEHRTLGDIFHSFCFTGVQRSSTANGSEHNRQR